MLITVAVLFASKSMVRMRKNAKTVQTKIWSSLLSQFHGKNTVEAWTCVKCNKFKTKTWLRLQSLGVVTEVQDIWRHISFAWHERQFPLDCISHIHRSRNNYAYSWSSVIPLLSSQLKSKIVVSWYLCPYSKWNLCIFFFAAHKPMNMAPTLTLLAHFHALVLT